jgi:hypothetical protein
MGFSKDRGERRMGLTSHGESQAESAQYSSKNSGNCHHGHKDARSCQWMVVIMENYMAENGKYNSDRRRKSQESGRRHTAPSQKKSVQTTKKPPAETSVPSSTACQGI